MGRAGTKGPAGTWEHRHGGERVSARGTGGTGTARTQGVGTARQEGSSSWDSVGRGRVLVVLPRAALLPSARGAGGGGRTTPALPMAGPVAQQWDPPGTGGFSSLTGKEGKSARESGPARTAGDGEAVIRLMGAVPHCWGCTVVLPGWLAQLRVAPSSQRLLVLSGINLDRGHTPLPSHHSCHASHSSRNAIWEQVGIRDTGICTLEYERCWREQQHNQHLPCGMGMAEGHGGG